jgi:hypothetical protein
MGQRANSNRNANLDEKKRRAAGRSTESKALNPLRDDRLEPPAKGRTGGASGRSGKANPRGGNLAAGNGGGGGYNTRNNSAPINVGRSTKRARKRG